MKKLFSEIQGKPVFSRDVTGAVARVFDLVLDPMNGTLVALSVHPSMGKIVGMRDILSWYPKIVIRDTDSIVEPEDVARVQQVLTHDYAPFLHNAVVTESGADLGRVYDYLFDLDAGIVLKIIVAKSFLGLVHFSERVISAKDIIRVDPGQIVVKDDTRVVEREVEMAGA